MEVKEIEKVEVRNVKGIQHKVFELGVIPNKPTILVAPNGYGKSSLATAFMCMNKNKIKLEKMYHHNNDPELLPRLELTLKLADGSDETLVATHESNELPNRVDWFVINNKIKAKVKPTQVNGSRRMSASIVVEPIVLVDTIPDRVDVDYSISSIKTDFGRNGKVLVNMSKALGSAQFLIQLNDNLSCLRSASREVITKRFNHLRETINSETGTAERLCDQVDSDLVVSLTKDYSVRSLMDLVVSVIPKVNPGVRALLCVWQILELYRADKKGFKKACKRAEYDSFKKEMKSYIAAFDVTNRRFTVKEAGKKLQVVFPDVSRISNGERDVVVFISQLIRSRKKLRSESCILIIDEVFDYLDDANLIAAQYYLTQLIEEYRELGKKLFPLILTHLNPCYFKGFAFSKRKVHFLQNSVRNANSTLLKVLRNRNNPAIKDFLASELLHFGVSKDSMEVQFESLGWPKEWGKPKVFERFVLRDMKRYVEGAEFCPMSVCCALRRMIEEIVYKRLECSNKKAKFLEHNKTVDRLNYAIGEGVEIQEHYYMLGVLYNEAMHPSKYGDSVSPVMSSLQNPTIRRLITAVYEEYDGAEWIEI